MIKKGFTLGETMLTLIILGIIAALTVPVLKNNFNSEKTNKYLYKKAFNTFSEAVYQVINDENLYDSDEGHPFQEESHNGKSICENIVAKMNTTNIDCTSSDIDENAVNFNKDFNPSFITADGMRWYMSKKNKMSDSGSNWTTVFGSGDSDLFSFIVYVDVNGKEGKSIEDEDVFRILLLDTGKVTLYNTPAYSKERDILESNET